MPDRKPALEYANKSTPGDSRRARGLIGLALFLLLILIVTVPFWWERLLQWAFPLNEQLH